jgi:DNA (cytosine-5)-methyltransferase 1
MQTNSEYVTVKDAAEMLGISPNTLRSWGASGAIVEYRHPVNNYRLYRRIDLEQLRKKLEQPQVSRPGVCL